MNSENNTYSNYLGKECFLVLYINKTVSFLYKINYIIKLQVNIFFIFRHKLFIPSSSIGSNVQSNLTKGRLLSFYTYQFSRFVVVFFHSRPDNIFIFTNQKSNLGKELFTIFGGEGVGWGGMVRNKNGGELHAWQMVTKQRTKQKELTITKKY